MAWQSSVSRLLLGLLPLAMLGGCVGASSYNAKSIAVPPNYRQLVARQIGTNLGGKLLSAEISRPGVWEVAWSGPRPIVCARWRVQGSLIEQTHTLLFLFADGKIAETMNPQYVNPAAGGAFGAALFYSATCGKLTYSRFPELGRAR